jgi:TRAP-type C4-dicarboxylate transport system substrate-binding protein
LFLGSRAVKAQPQGGNSRRFSAPRDVPTQNNPRDRWMAMPPQDRQLFRRNAERWMQIGPEERKILREREQLYRERVKRDIDAALHESGLRLEGEKREQFEQRYLQERRRIEHQLRQEVEAKRKEELPALQERLKKEFQETSASAASTGSPVKSASPKK